MPCQTVKQDSQSLRGIPVDRLIMQQPEGFHPQQQFHRAVHHVLIVAFGQRPLIIIVQVQVQQHRQSTAGHASMFDILEVVLLLLLCVVIIVVVVVVVAVAIASTTSIAATLAAPDRCPVGSLAVSGLPPT